MGELAAAGVAGGVAGYIATGTLKGAIIGAGSAMIMAGAAQISKSIWVNPDAPTSGLVGRTMVNGAAGAGVGALRGQNPLAGFLSYGMNPVIDWWQPTKWGPLNTEGVLTTADFKEATAAVSTSWGEVAGKVAMQGALTGAAASLNGGKFEDGLNLGIFGGASREVYRAFLPVKPVVFGTGDGGTYKQDTPGAIVVLGSNNFGTFQTNNPLGFFTEGALFSRAMDGYIPGMSSISYIHDAWAVMGNFCESSVCATMMMPAAIVSYGALYDSIQRSGGMGSAFLSPSMEIKR